MTNLDEEPERTLPGGCHSCGAWTAAGRIVSDEGGASGGGETVLRCAACVAQPNRYRRRRDHTEPRRYSL